MTKHVLDELTIRCLQASIRSLRQDVLPAVSSESTRVHIDIITRVLLLLHRRFDRRAQDLQRVIEEDERLAQRIEATIPTAPVTSPRGQTAVDLPIDELETQRFALEEGIGRSIPALCEIAASESPEASRALRDLQDLLTVQEGFLIAQDPDIVKGSAVCYRGGRMDAEPIFSRGEDSDEALTPTKLTTYLQRRFPGSTVDRLAAIAGGFSKTTFLFTLKHASGRTEELVMRKDLPVDFISSVASEFSLLKPLFEQGFPVAEPCWLESDPGALGARFLVSRLVSGSTDVSRWISDRTAAQGFARQLAELMERLHALSLPALGFSPSLKEQSAGECMRSEIDRWHSTFLSSRLEAYPLVELTLEWLKQHIPPTLYARPGALVHGDIGFHNMMIDNGHLTALLDWEFAHPGDPLEDLVYTKPFVESVMDWTTFKGWYRDLGGPACSEAEEMFYAVWSKTRNQISAIRATRLFMGSQPNNLKFAAAGFVLARYFEPEAARMVVSALESSSNSRR